MTAWRGAVLAWGEVAAFFVLFFAVLAVGWRMVQSRLVRQGYDPGRLPPARTVTHTFDPEMSVRFKGGARVGRANASAPLVALTVDGHWAHLEGGRWARPYIDSVWIRRDEVKAVCVIDGGDGIRFTTADGALDGVIFWTFAAPAVTDAFECFGWPIAPT